MLVLRDTTIGVAFFGVILMALALTDRFVHSQPWIAISDLSLSTAGDFVQKDARERRRVWNKSTILHRSVYRNSGRGSVCLRAQVQFRTVLATRRCHRRLLQNIWRPGWIWHQIWTPQRKEKPRNDGTCGDRRRARGPRHWHSNGTHI